jgi:hypothetical protein
MGVQDQMTLFLTEAQRKARQFQKSLEQLKVIVLDKALSEIACDVQLFDNFFIS